MSVATAPLDAAFAPSLRLARSEDAAAMSVFLQGLSARTRRLRLHGACVAASPALALRLCSVDGVRHQAWLAWAGAGVDAVVVGEARFVMSAGGTHAELAVVVADQWQGRGVAHALMRQLLDAARQAGVAEIHGDVLDDNLRMQAFMRGHGFEVDPFASGDALRMTRDLRGARRAETGGWKAWLSKQVAARMPAWLAPPSLT